MNVVFDTNVVVSGFLNPHGPPGQLLQKVAEGEISLCFDARILAEYEAVLKRPRFGLSSHHIESFMAQVESEGFLAGSYTLSHSLPDKTDQPFLEVALNSRAECLVTGNLKHFPANACEGMRVLSPASFLESLQKKLR